MRLLPLAVVLCVGCAKPDPFPTAKLVVELKGDATLPAGVEPKLEVKLRNESEAPLSFVRYEGSGDATWLVGRYQPDGGVKLQPAFGRLKCGVRDPPDPEADRAREEAHRRAARTVTLEPGASIALTATTDLATTFSIEEPGQWQVRARFELTAPVEPRAEAETRKLEVLSAPIDLTVTARPPVVNLGILSGMPVVKPVVERPRLVGKLAAVESASLTAKGDFDKEGVARVLTAHQPEVSKCFEREAGMAGKVVLEWMVSPTGEVEAAKLRSSTHPSSEVEDCLLAALKRWKFRPDGVFGLTLAYPFTFDLVPADVAAR